MLEETANGGAPAVARRGRVRPAALDVIEEAGDRVRVEIIDHQSGDVSTIALSGELE
jgi:hypothetical protein